MKKCKYCNRKMKSEDYYCSAKCKEHAELYLKRWMKYKFMYCVIIIVSLISIVGQIILFPEFTTISKVLIMIMGATFFVLPFGNTTDSLGVKKTVIIVRVLALLLIVVAVVCMIFDV